MTPYNSTGQCFRLLGCGKRSTVPPYDTYGKALYPLALSADGKVMHSLATDTIPAFDAWKEYSVTYHQLRGVSGADEFAFVYKYHSDLYLSHTELWKKQVRAASAVVWLPCRSLCHRALPYG